MTEQILDAELRAYQPGSSTPIVSLSDTLTEVSLRETTQPGIDSGTIRIENTDNVINQTTRITSGDRLEFDIQLEGETSLSRRFTGIARDVTDEIGGGDVRRVEIEMTEFVQTALSFRSVDGAFESVDCGAIVDSLVAADAPEVDRDQIKTVGTDATLTVNGRVLLDVVQQQLAPRGDAVVTSKKQALVFKALDDIAVSETVTPSDVHAPIQVQRVDDELINRVRVDGGTDTALDDAQTTQSASVRVTDSSRETFEVFSRKSEIASVEIFTIPDSTASRGLTVRVQAAESGSAVDPSDTTSDIARRELAPPFLAQSDFTEFQLPNHSLAPAENPFIIVEGAGPTGHDIGTDGNGNVSFKAFFPFPLLARSENAGSITDFRRRDLRRRDDQLDSEQATQEAAQSALRHRGLPKRRLTATAATPETHRLQPSDVIRLAGFDVGGVTGTFAVTERQTTFNGRLLDTELTFRDTQTL